MFASSSVSSSSSTSLLVATVLLMAVGSLLIASPAAGQDLGQNPFDGPVPNGSGPTIDGQASIQLVGGVPQGGLHGNMSTGMGLQGFVGGWTGPGSPLMVGLDVGVLHHGHTTGEVPFSSTVDPWMPAEVTTSTNVLQAHLSLRLQPRTGWFRPYVEGLIGFKYLFTRTSIGEEVFEVDVGDEESLDDGLGSEIASSTDIASSANYDDLALSGGAGAGVDIRVFQQDGAATTVQAVSLNLGVRYLLGTEAEYRAEGSLTDENDNGRLEGSELDVRRSRTTFLQPQFGVTLRLADTD
jgi:hypothetical protein